MNIRLDIIQNAPLSKKLLILGVIYTLFIVIFYLYFFNPMRVEINKLNGRLTKLNGIISDSKVIASDISKYRKEKERLEQELKDTIVKLPDKKEIPGLISNISRLARLSGLDILLLMPVAERTKEYYVEIPVNMKVAGRFPGLYNFYRKIMVMPRIISIEAIHISKDTELKEEARLTAEFLATTYRFLADADKKMKKAKVKKVVGPDKSRIVSQAASRKVVYEAVKRDPFKPFLLTNEHKVIKRGTPLERYPISRLKLVALIKGKGPAAVMIETPDGKGYVVKKGEYLGDMNGRIVDITEEGIVVIERYRDKRGRVVKKESMIYLHTNSGEE